MNWLFRRHFWVVHVMFLSIVAAISAKTVTSLVGYRVSKSIPEKPPASLFEEQKEEVVERIFSVASERNLFAARREQISLLDADDEQANSGRWQDAGPSSLPLKLISTMVFTDPYDSRAVIQVNGGPGLVYSLRDCDDYQKNYDQSRIETIIPSQKWQPDRACNDLGGMAIVKRIEEFRVYIYSPQYGYQYLSLLPEDKMPIHRTPANFEVIEGEGVRKTGPTSYEINQGEFDKALANVARLLTEARAVPEMDSNGNSIGFKIVYLKEGSLFEKIGIERSDVLTRINGYEMNSPEKALQLFGKLRTASQFTIDLKRGDRSVTLDYSVVR